jgi:hypothetical protein
MSRTLNVYTPNKENLCPAMGLQEMYKMNENNANSEYANGEGAGIRLKSEMD